MLNVKNAIIKSVKLTKADHSQLTLWLDLDYGGATQTLFLITMKR